MKKRSKKLLEAMSKVDSTKLYGIDEALKLCKEIKTFQAILRVN